MYIYIAGIVCLVWDGMGWGDVCRSYSLLAVSIRDTHRGVGRRSVSGVHIATRQRLSPRSNGKTTETVAVLVLQLMQVLEDLEG